MDSSIQSGAGGGGGGGVSRADARQFLFVSQRSVALKRVDMRIATAFLRKRRLWLSLVLLVCLMLAFLGVSFVIMRHAGIRDLEHALAETDKLDPYWRLEDLEAHRRPMLPPDKNGYEQIMAAVRVIPTQPWPQPTFPQFDNDRNYQRRVVAAMRSSLRQHDRLSPVLLSEEEARVLRVELERAKDCIAQVRKMIDFPLGRGPSIWPNHGLVVSTPPLYLKTLDVAKMMAPDVRVRIYDGDVAGAILDIRAVLYISSFLADEPTLMAQLIRVAQYITALEMLEQTLAGGTTSEEELAVLQRELESEAMTPTLSIGLRGHRALTDNDLNNAQTGVTSKDELWAQTITRVSTPGMAISTRISQAIQFAILYSNIPGERARLLRESNELIAISHLPWHERLQALEEYGARNKKQAGSWFDLTQSFFGGSMFAKYMIDEFGAATSLLCAITAVAAERFRLANRRWPRNLEELVPTYLKAVPLDPYCGQPLRLIRKNSALIIYSVGENQIDDDGSLGRQVSFGGLDIGFILHDPEQRRRPRPPFVFPERTETDPKNVERP